MEIKLDFAGPYNNFEFHPKSDGNLLEVLKTLGDRYNQFLEVGMISQVQNVTRVESPRCLEMAKLRKQILYGGTSPPG